MTNKALKRFVLGKDKITIGELLSLEAEGLIRPWKDNRGGRPLNEKKVDYYAHNWNTKVAGELGLALNAGGFLRLCDFHHRMAGLKRAAALGLIADRTNQEINYSIVAEEESLELYIKAAEARRHSKAENILQPQFVYGKIAAFLEREFGRAIPNTKFCSIYRDIVYTLSVRDNFDLLIAASFGPKAAKLETKSADDSDNTIFISPAKRKKLAEAFGYYDEFVTALKGYYPKNKKGIAQMGATAKSLVSSAAFFGLVICDHLNGSPKVTSRTPESLAKRVLKQDSRTLKLASSLLKKKEKERAYMELVNLLK